MLLGASAPEIVHSFCAETQDKMDDWTDPEGNVFGGTPKTATGTAALPSILAFELGEAFVAADAGFAGLEIDGGNFLVQRKNLAFGSLGVLHHPP